jgi:hypothetical protein
MMARSTNAPFKGRIQKRKTNHLQIITFGLQRTAGPYKCANSGSAHHSIELKANSEYRQNQTSPKRPGKSEDGAYSKRRGWAHH